MTIIVKLPINSKYVLPRMCVACGSQSELLTGMVYRYESQALSRTIFSFPACGWCVQFANIPIYSKQWKKLYEPLSPEEKEKALNASFCVRVKIPYFYIGKREFYFHNEAYGILFWKLNGGDMSQVS
mgnify:CR=1 FL=1